MDKFCFVVSPCKKKGWIVESKNVYKADNRNNLVPITFNESEDTEVYIRNVGLPLNYLLIAGSDGNYFQPLHCFSSQTNRLKIFIKT